jgi:ribose 5-phosphate isomerase B
VRIVVGSDHAGYDLKELVAAELTKQGHQVQDVGTTDATTSVDYPTFGVDVGHTVASGHADLGVAVCGSGIGIAIAANKVQGVRAAVVHDVTSARLAREHNHANVLCLGARLLGPRVALDAVQAWLDAAPIAGRHEARVAQLDHLGGPDSPERKAP